MLEREPLGSFMVRESESVPGNLALSLRVPRTFLHHGIAHYIILKTRDGYKIKASTAIIKTMVWINKKYLHSRTLIKMFIYIAILAINIFLSTGYY